MVVWVRGHMTVLLLVLQWNLPNRTAVKIKNIISKERENVRNKSGVSMTNTQHLTHEYKRSTRLAVGSHSTVEIARFNCKFCSNSLPASCFPLSYENLNTTSIVVFCHFKSCALLFSPLHNIFSVYYTLGNLCKALMNAGGHASWNAVIIKNKRGQ